MTFKEVPDQSLIKKKIEVLLLCNIKVKVCLKKKNNPRKCYLTSLHLFLLFIYFYISTVHTREGNGDLN